MEDKQTIYSLIEQYHRKADVVEEARGWEDEFFNVAAEEREAAWQELRDAVFFEGADKPAVILSKADLKTDEQVRIVTEQLARLNVVFNSREVKVPDGGNTGAIEAVQIDELAGPMMAAAQLVNNELKRRGEEPFRIGIEGTGYSQLNPAIVALIKRQVEEAFSSDGLAVYVTGISTEELVVSGPYPGPLTAKWLHRNAGSGVAIELEETPSGGNGGLLTPTDFEIDPETGAYGWVNLYTGSGIDTHTLVDGPWRSREAAATARDDEEEVVTLPIFGPIQFTP